MLMIPLLHRSIWQRTIFITIRKVPILLLLVLSSGDTSRFESLQVTGNWPWNVCFSRSDSSDHFFSVFRVQSYNRCDGDRSQPTLMGIDSRVPSLLETQIVAICPLSLLSWQELRRNHFRIHTFRLKRILQETVTLPTQGQCANWFYQKSSCHGGLKNYARNQNTISQDIARSPILYSPGEPLSPLSLQIRLKWFCVLTNLSTHIPLRDIDVQKICMRTLKLHLCIVLCTSLPNLIVNYFDILYNGAISLFFHVECRNCCDQFGRHWYNPYKDAKRLR